MDQCPPQSDLRSFVVRGLSLKESLRVADHAAACHRCKAALESIALQLQRRLIPSPAPTSQVAGRPLNSVLSDPLSAQLITPAGATGNSWLGARVDHFVLTALLGAGGMGAVYRATDTLLKRTVAVKILRNDMVGGTGRDALFWAEARSAAQMEHENIARLYQVGSFGGEPYIVMELVNGIDLQRLAESKGILQERTALRLIYQAACGLRFAHTSGIVHRDIKPSNLMVTRERVVKVLDFGLARSAAALRIQHEVAGTPLFMSPEQWRGTAVGFTSDVFSLTGTLFFLLTLRTPILFSSGRARIADIPTDIHPSIRAILICGLDRSPGNRYRDAGALADALKEVRGVHAKTQRAAISMMDPEKRSLGSLPTKDITKLIKCYQAIGALSFVPLIGGLACLIMPIVNMSDLTIGQIVACWLVATLEITYFIGLRWKYSWAIHLSWLAVPPLFFTYVGFFFPFALKRSLFGPERYRIEELAAEQYRRIAMSVYENSARARRG